jgi:hypothetical protein
VVDGNVAISCTPASGSVFSLGLTTVSCTATDAHSNVANGSFTVTVEDTTGATISDVPENQTVEASGASGAVAAFSAPTAQDLVDGTVAVNCAPTSGSTFSLGATTVTCTATDTHDNTSTASFIVTVEDTTPPAINDVPTDQTLEATSTSGAVANYPSPAASDLVDGDVSVDCTPASGSTFALGTTMVTCTATDAHDNTSTASFNVTVEDTTAPTLALPAGMTVDATGPDGAAVTFEVTASDIADVSATVVCTPASGSTFPIGSTTVQCSAADASGNASDGTFEVYVRGAAEQAEDLAAAVAGVGPGKSLSSKVQTLRNQIDAGDSSGACRTLDSLLNEVRAQTGKHITTLEAEGIQADADRIADILGCT